MVQGGEMLGFIRSKLNFSTSLTLSLLLCQREALGVGAGIVDTWGVRARIERPRHTGGLH